MDLGGAARSGHSDGLARLMRLGLAERRQRTDCGETFPRSRASWEYKITDAGLSFLNAMDQPADEKGAQSCNRGDRKGFESLDGSRTLPG
jgi:hypothetical protein